MLALLFRRRSRLRERDAEARGERPRRISNDAAFKKAGIKVERVEPSSPATQPPARANAIAGQSPYVREDQQRGVR